MKLDPILTKAVRLARKKNYDSAIKILESEHNRYYGKFTYYYVLGLSYLYSRIYGVALRYLNLAIEQKLRDVNTLLGLASLYLNHGDTDKAIDLYLEVQSIDETNKIAKRALEIIKKNPGPENISAWIESGKIDRIFPPFPGVGLPRNLLLSAGIFLVLGMVAIFGITLGRGIISGRELRPIPDETLLVREEQLSPVQTGGVYRYVLTSDQVLNEYNAARRFFAEYRDEAARVRINLILESNASEPVKNRARILQSYLQEPGFDNLSDRFTYNEVIQDPFLYRDTHVIWRGMASNLVSGHDYTTFDFLVGYDTRRVVEGIVQVSYNFAIPINLERPVEILGRIIPISDDRIQIYGLAINQAGLLDRIP